MIKSNKTKPKGNTNFGKQSDHYDTGIQDGKLTHTTGITKNNNKQLNTDQYWPPLWLGNPWFDW